jgi:hypothetical protein
VLYEILLPRTFNDGAPVPSSLLLETKDDLVKQFGGVTLHQEPVTGYWMNDGIEYTDSLIRITVGCSASEENEVFIRNYKEVLKQRFSQIEVWIVEHQIRII